MLINKAALHQAQAARFKYRANTPLTIQSIDGEDEVLIAAYLEATHTPALPAGADEKSCHLCDCTGDVNRGDGEWQGSCPYCTPKRESGGWQSIESLPAKLNDDVFVAYFISRGDCAWVKLKRTSEQVRGMMTPPTHWMYVPSVTNQIEDAEPKQPPEAASSAGVGDLIARVFAKCEKRIKDKTLHGFGSYAVGIHDACLILKEEAALSGDQGRIVKPGGRT